MFLISNFIDSEINLVKINVESFNKFGIFQDKNVCIISTQKGIDDEDNDCDGLLNEDVCYDKYGVYREGKHLKSRTYNFNFQQE